MRSKWSPSTSSGRARSVIATRERTDPNRELWWAHTGAGGGNSRHRHPLLVPLGRRVRRRSRRCCPRRRSRSPRSRRTGAGATSIGVLPAPARKPRHAGASSTAGRFARRLAVDAARRPSPAVRQDLHPRREHRRRGAERQAHAYLARSREGLRAPDRSALADVVARLRAESVSRPVHDAARRRVHEGEGRTPQEAAHRSPDRRRLRLPHAQRSRRDGQACSGSRPTAGGSTPSRPTPPPRPATRHLRPGVHDRLAGPEGRAGQPGVGPRLLSRSVCRHRRRAGARRRLRRRADQSPGYGPGGTALEYVGGRWHTIYSRPTTRVCSASRRSGIRETSFTTRCRFAEGSVAMATV